MSSERGWSLYRNRCHQLWLSGSALRLGRTSFPVISILIPEEEKARRKDNAAFRRRCSLFVFGFRLQALACFFLLGNELVCFLLFGSLRSLALLFPLKSLTGR